MKLSDLPKIQRQINDLDCQKGLLDKVKTAEIYGGGENPPYEIRDLLSVYVQQKYISLTNEDAATFLFMLRGLLENQVQQSETGLKNLGVEID